MVLVVAAITVLGVGAGHFVANNLIADQQKSQLGELAQIALRRAESNVDFGRDALEDLRKRGLTNCDAATLQNVRFQVYEWGPVKDIRVANGNASVRCSAFSETLEFDRSWPGRDEMVRSTDGTLSLFRVDQYSGVAMGVLMDIGEDTTLIAILATNTGLIDVMPAELRDTSKVLVEISGSDAIAEMDGLHDGMAPADTLTFTARSDRYPLSGSITVPYAALTHWHQQIYLPIVGLATALGAAFGLIFARIIFAPKSLEQILEKAIQNDEILPYVQPVFDLKTGCIVGGEVLARWTRPNGEIVSPARFIPLAEETGLVGDLTWNLLARVLSDLRSFLKENKDFVISINVSPVHFVQPEFADDLRRKVAEAGVPASHISLEITERQPFADLAIAANAVRQVQSLGFKVSIDDVGIGHSGLSHLQSLGANTIKIDKFFVDTIDSDSTAKSIVEMLVRLADKLDMSTVAEGIELETQATALTALGVARGQGFLVSPALPVSDFVAAVVASQHKSRAVSNAA